MTEITFFHSPGACSRVTMNALEEIGLAFEDIPLNLPQGDQHKPDYLAINPQGKVPSLKWGDRVITENASILYFLHNSYPEAKLLPDTGDKVIDSRCLSDMLWCASTLHIATRQIAVPMLFSADQACHNSISQRGGEVLKKAITTVENRLQQGPWWYGDSWSIVDVYLYWVLCRASIGGFALAGHKDLIAYSQRIKARPSFIKALKREEKAAEKIGSPLRHGEI